jgi:hypothetical protein
MVVLGYDEGIIVGDLEGNSVGTGVGVIEGDALLDGT